ncbi:hypothetical protein EVAR_7162_1 [Eumeta japonica]|uniref:Uncharacterized protein n=1 Tax=Eumeta variegata TaxID=151549 RepID=A0A4C1U784_EUMVA|nr:hypothetical protein EVAR_7162_1 [Eumeta japonica]
MVGYKSDISCKSERQVGRRLAVRGDLVCPFRLGYKRSVNPFLPWRMAATTADRQPDHRVRHQIATIVRCSFHGEGGIPGELVCNPVSKSQNNRTSLSSLMTSEMSP